MVMVMILGSRTDLRLDTMHVHVCGAAFARSARELLSAHGYGPIGIKLLASAKWRATAAATLRLV